MYKPDLVLGVEHTENNIENVRKFLDPYVEAGTRVGTEAYAYPISDSSLVDRDFSRFFDSMGDFVKSKNGLYVPLQKEEDFRHRLDLMERVGFLNDYEKFFRILQTAFVEGGFNLTSPLTPYDITLNDFIFSDYVGKRLHKLLHLKHGFDVSEQRDRTLLELTKKEEPQVIVAGYMHVIPLILEYDIVPKIIREPISETPSIKEITKGEIDYI